MLINFAAVKKPEKNLKIKKKLFHFVFYDIKPYIVKI